MREKIVEYNGNEYKVKLCKDHLGLTTLKIYKKEKLFFIPVWDEINRCWWDYKIEEETNVNPIEFSMEVIRRKEEKAIKKEEYEKKLDEWFK